MSSWWRNLTYSPPARMTERFQFAIAGSRFAATSMRIRGSPYERTTSAVSSVEPPSETTSSNRS